MSSPPSSLGSQPLTSNCVSVGVMSSGERAEANATSALITQAVALRNEYAKAKERIASHESHIKVLDSRIDNLLTEKRGLINQFADEVIADGQRKQVEGRAMQVEGRAMQVEGRTMQAEAQVKIQKANHEDASSALIKLFLACYLPAKEEFIKLPESRQKELRTQAVAKCSQFIEPYLTTVERSNPKDLFKYVDAKRCLRMTSLLADVITTIFKDVSCSTLNFFNFQDEMDPQSLKKILSDKKVTSVTFHVAVMSNNELKAVVMDVKKNHHDFKIEFIKV